MTISWKNLELAKKYAAISRTYQNSNAKVKTCKQLDVFLINYLHCWCNVLNNKNYYNEQSNISYSLYIHSISSLEEKAWIQSLYNKSLLQFITILSNSRQILAMKLSLHLICFIIRLYSCNINPHLVNLWFLSCMFLINVTVLWSYTTNGWNVHHNCFKDKNKASHCFSIVDYFCLIFVNI